MNKKEYQTAPGQLGACCVSMGWALSCGYVRKGYLWTVDGHPQWIHWTLKIKGPGYYDVSTIHFCPFCGKSLDEGED